MRRILSPGILVLLLGCGGEVPAPPAAVVPAPAPRPIPKAPAMPKEADPAPAPPVAVAPTPAPRSDSQLPPPQDPARDLRAEFDQATASLNFLAIAAHYAVLRGSTIQLKDLTTAAGAARERVDELLGKLRGEGRNPHVEETLRVTDVLEAFDNQSMATLGPERSAALVGTFLAQFKPGLRVRVLVKRENEILEFTMRFDERPKEYLPVLQTIELIPGQVVKAAEAPVARKPDPAEPPKPETPRPLPVPDPVPAPAEVAPLPRVRLAPPDAVALKESEKQVKTVFKDDYARKSPADQQALARRLLTQGLSPESMEAPLRYVLLGEARDLGLQVADFETSLKAVDGLAETFELEPVAAKAALMAKAKPAKGAEGAADYAKALCAVIEQGLATGEVEAVTGLATKADAAARASADGPLVARAQALAKDVQYVAKEASAIRSHRKMLETKPEDPSANLALGRFLCLVIGDWKRGLPILAKGGDAALRSLAEREIAAPSEPAAQASLADAWWEVSEKERNAELKKRERARALEWYEKALPGVTGLAKAKVELRLRESGKVIVGSGRTAKSQAVGGSGGNEFEDVSRDGGLLVGLKYSLSPYGASSIVKSVQPIYLAGSKRIEGKSYGAPAGTMLEVVAKPGYAVGGLVLRGGIRVDAMKVVFMRVAGTALEPRDKYESSWIGGTEGGSEVRIGGDGAFVVGLHGRYFSDLDCLGIIQAAR